MPYPLLLYCLDCTYEQMINYGGDFPINLWEAKPTITVEFRPKAVEANQTSR